MSIDALETSDSSETELLTTMESYTLQWTPSLSSWLYSCLFSWNGREISVLLPSGTQYSRGTIKQETENGYYITQDLVNASNGIPVYRSEKVDFVLNCSSKQVMGDIQFTRTLSKMASVSLSLLGNISKEEYLDQLKKRNVEVLSQTENSIITREKGTGFSAADTLEKTIISGDVVLQVRVSSPQQPVSTSPYYLVLEKIEFAPTKGSAQ